MTLAKNLKKIIFSFDFVFLRINSCELMKAYFKQFDNGFGKEFEK